MALATWTSRAACVATRLLLLEDVNTIRETNNAIFDDIFWVHLAYATAENGIERLRDLLQNRTPATLPSSPASRRSTKDAGSCEDATASGRGPTDGQ